MKKLFFTAVAVVALSFSSGASSRSDVNLSNFEEEMYVDCIAYAFDYDADLGPVSYEFFDMLVRQCEIKYNQH